MPETPARGKAQVDWGGPGRWQVLGGRIWLVLRHGSGLRPQGQEFGGAGAQAGEAFGVQVVPDGQMQPPELLADRELGCVRRRAAAWPDVSLICGRARNARAMVNSCFCPCEILVAF